MRILLDEQLPRRLTRHILGHDVRTVQEQGWAGLRNGELLRRAGDAGFNAFLTADQNLQFQQNLAGAKLGVIILVAASNKLDDLLALMPEALAVIGETRPGDVRRVGPALTPR